MTTVILVLLLVVLAVTLAIVRPTGALLAESDPVRGAERTRADLAGWWRHPA